MSNLQTVFASSWKDYGVKHGLDSDNKCVEHAIRESVIIDSKKPTVFDWKRYIKDHPDLQRALGKGRPVHVNDATCHYLSHGIKENRKKYILGTNEPYVYDFDWKMYDKLNPDVFTQRHRTNVGEWHCFRHWCEYGYKEDRKTGGCKQLVVKTDASISTDENVNTMWKDKLKKILDLEPFINVDELIHQLTTSQCKIHNVCKNIKSIIICSHSNLSHTSGDTIMLSNWINHFMDHNIHVTLLSKSSIPTSFVRNLVAKSYTLVQCKDNNDLIIKMNELQKTKDRIFIRNHEILDKLRTSSFIHKICFYGLDIHLDGIALMQNKFHSIITQSEQLKTKYVVKGVLADKIEVVEPLTYKYNFKLPERKDNEIRLIYCGTLRDEENILEIIEEFQKIHKERHEMVLKIVYGKINGNVEFTKKVNGYIKKGVPGITFKHNLSHRDSCYEIATSDIGICWRKNGYGDNGEVSTKVKEYEMYGLEIINNMKLKVGVVTSTNKLNKIDNIIRNFKQQLYFNKKLFLVLNNNDIDVNYIQKQMTEHNILYEIINLDEKFNLGHCLNEAIKKLKEQNYDIFSKFDDDDIYERKYLLEQVYYLNETKCDIVGKYDTVIYQSDKNKFYKIKNFDIQNEFTNFCRGSTITYNINKINTKFNEEKISGVDSEFIKNKKIFSTSNKNYIWIRFDNINKHTWKIDINKQFNLIELQMDKQWELYMDLHETSPYKNIIYVGDFNKTFKDGYLFNVKYLNKLSHDYNENKNSFVIFENNTKHTDNKSELNQNKNYHILNNKSEYLSIESLYYKYNTYESKYISNLNKHNIIVSIIITSYNVNYTILKRTLLPFTKSKNKVYFEIILVDDCSPMPYDDIIHWLRENEFNWSYVKNIENNGTYYSRNVGVLSSIGKYICFLDSDDYFDIENFDLLVNTVMETNYISYRYKRFMKNVDERSTTWPFIAILYNRTIFDKIGYFLPVRFGGDIEFFYRFSKLITFENCFRLDKTIYIDTNEINTRRLTTVYSKQNNYKQNTSNVRVIIENYLISYYNKHTNRYTKCVYMQRGKKKTLCITLDNITKGLYWDSKYLNKLFGFEIIRIRPDIYNKGLHNVNKIKGYLNNTETNDNEVHFNSIIHDYENIIIFETFNYEFFKYLLDLKIKLYWIPNYEWFISENLNNLSKLTKYNNFNVVSRTTYYPEQFKTKNICPIIIPWCCAKLPEFEIPYNFKKKEIEYLFIYGNGGHNDRKNLQIILSLLDMYPTIHLTITTIKPITIKDKHCYNNVNIVCNLTHDKLFEMVSQCDCILYPCKTDGLGYTILEGFYYDKPVIITNVEPINQYYKNNVLLENLLINTTNITDLNFNKHAESDLNDFYNKIKYFEENSTSFINKSLFKDIYHKYLNNHLTKMNEFIN